MPLCRPGVRFTGVDCSAPMVEAAREELAAEITAGQAEVVLGDAAAVPFNSDSFDVVLCVLTLQFVPIEVRSQRVRSLFRATKPGGRHARC